MKGSFTLAGAALAVLFLAEPGQAQVRKLTDAELDRVTAGGVIVPQQNVPTSQPGSPLDFNFKSPAGSRHTVEGTGTVQVLEQPNVKSSGISSVVVRDNAQQNLQSFINVTAANSIIQVLVNLNISINSTVGAIQQINSSGKP